MLYPVYVYPGDINTAHGVTFPDFPGCFSAADRWEDLPKAIQEAAEAHFADGENVPPPSDLAALSAQDQYQGGMWFLADLDLSRLSVKAVRVNITLPENLLHTIDRYAQDHHMSRSAFLARAAKQSIEA